MGQGLLHRMEPAENETGDAISVLAPGQLDQKVRGQDGVPVLAEHFLDILEPGREQHGVVAERRNRRLRRVPEGLGRLAGLVHRRDVIRVGQRCTVVAKAWPKREYNGVVSRLLPIADRAKGAVPVRVKVTVPADEEGVYLKPEMNATVVFLNSPLAAPATAKSAPAAVPRETSAFPAKAE